MINPIIPASAVKVAIIADLHIPFQSDVHLEQAIKILKDEKPDVIVVDGDLIDFFEISKYNTDPSLDFFLEKQIPMAKDFLSELRRDHPLTKIILVCGNHEFRVRSYLINHARAIYKFLEREVAPDGILPTALKLNELNIEWVDTLSGAARWTDTYFYLDNIKIGHFDKVSNPVIPAGMTVRGLMSRGGGSYVQAHVHRAAIIYNTDYEGNLTFGVETPCLASDPYYRKYVNWQRGLSVLYKTKFGWRPELIVL